MLFYFCVPFVLEYEKLCLAHFCEIHGPTSIVVTQALANPATVNTTSGGPAPTATTGNNNKNNKNTGIGDVYCDSCRLKLPYQEEDTTSLRTTTKHGVTYLSMQTPASAADKFVLKQACLQLLSSELTFNDSTPIMVSSSSSGTSSGFAYMGLVFKIQDNSSRGHVRKYALIALAETDQTLMRDWTYLANYFNRIRTWMVKSPETTTVPNTSTASSTSSSCGGSGNPAVAASTTLPDDDNDDTVNNEYSSYTSPPSLFLRTREAKTQSKSLPELLKNDNFFEELHARFTQIQSTLDKKYSNSF